MKPDPEKAHVLMRLAAHAATNKDASQKVLVTICEVANGTMDSETAFLLITNSSPQFRPSRLLTPPILSVVPHD